MIIIYRNHDNSWHETAIKLKDQGLLNGRDWRFENQNCFRGAHIKEGTIYTSSYKIAGHYEAYPDVVVERI